MPRKTIKRRRRRSPREATNPVVDAATRPDSETDFDELKEKLQLDLRYKIGVDKLSQIMADIHDDEIAETVRSVYQECIDLGLEEDDKRLGRVGRPREYDPRKHIPVVIQCMSIGMSKKEVAAKLGILSQNMCRWERTYPSFSKAMEVGADLAEAYWEKWARQNVNNKNCNTKLFTWIMSTRYGIREKQEHEHTLNGKVDHNHVAGKVLRNMSTEQLEQMQGILPPADEIPVDNTHTSGKR